MVSEFKKKKYLHLFTRFFDFDKSGSVDKDDFIQISTKMAKMRGYNEGEPAAHDLKELLTKIWKGLLAQTGKDSDGAVSADEFIKTWDDYAKNPAGAPEWQHLYCKAAFKFLDYGGDGEIDVDEFAKVNEIFGLDAAKSREAFAKMAKGKAKINFDDYKVLFNEFFTSDNPDAPGSFVFGIRPI